MTAQDVDSFTVDTIEDLLPRPLRTDEGVAVNAVKEAPTEGALRKLIKEEEVDYDHDGERGIGAVREAVLESELAPKDLKQAVSTRGDPTPELELRVPDEVVDTSLGALEAGKPVVLYGPTGTGKTTFAKQLALMTSIGYSLETAAPSWTEQDIVGRVAPDYTGESVSYTKEPGCVSEAVIRARKYNEPYSVIIDELTRADISKIFGPLYTAVENPHQTIFTTDSGEAIQLDPRVNIIATMNMSDRTVNDLDNAITRRFAMVEVSKYTAEQRENLFADWTSKYIAPTNSQVDTGALQQLFEDDYVALNGLSDSDFDNDRGIMPFGPMHYKDVAEFVGAVTSSDGRYQKRPNEAVGEAFRTYIVPRLLNAATYSQLADLIEHYEAMNEEYDFELERALKLIEDEKESEQQRMGT